MIIIPITNRIEPAGGPEFYKTYAVTRPRSTHTRAATCAEVECGAHRRGWRTTLDLSTDLGKARARYVRDHSGRRFTVITERPLLVLEFPAGQQCFAEHRVPLDRPPVYSVRGGDYRGNPTAAPTVIRSGADWVDDFGEHQLKIKEARERG